MGRQLVNVAGVTFNNDDGSNRQAILSEMSDADCGIYLLDESTEEHPEAIAVYNRSWQQIGFVPKHIAIHIRNMGIPIYEIDIVSCEFYSWKPTVRHSYGDDCGYEDEEIYGCKFVMEHELIGGDADDYEDKPVRSLNLTWDGIELRRTAEQDENEWEDEEDDWLTAGRNTTQRSMTPEEAAYIQELEIERELAEMEKEKQYRRQSRHEFMTTTMIVATLIAVAAVIIRGFIN